MQKAGMLIFTTEKLTSVLVLVMVEALAQLSRVTRCFDFYGGLLKINFADLYRFFAWTVTYVYTYALT